MILSLKDCTPAVRLRSNARVRRGREDWARHHNYRGSGARRLGPSEVQRAIHVTVDLEEIYLKKGEFAGVA